MLLLIGLPNKLLLSFRLEPFCDFDDSDAYLPADYAFYFYYLDRLSPISPIAAITLRICSLK